MCLIHSTVFEAEDFGYHIITTVLKLIAEDVRCYILITVSEAEEDRCY